MRKFGNDSGIVAWYKLTNDSNENTFFRSRHVPKVVRHHCNVHECHRATAAAFSRLDFVSSMFCSTAVLRNGVTYRNLLRCVSGSSGALGRCSNLTNCLRLSVYRMLYSMPYMDLDDLDGTWSSLAHWSGMLCVMVLVLGRYVNVAGNHWYVLVRYGLFWHDMTWCATVCDLNVFVCEYATACDVTWLDMYPVSNFCYMTCDMWDYVSKSKRSVKVKVRLVKVSMSQSTM